MTRNTFTHPQYSEHYFAGLEAMRIKIEQIGFDAARDAFNSHYPLSHKHVDLAAYYCAEGEIDALVQYSR
jgi:hypothetical protein